MYSGGVYVCTCPHPLCLHDTHTHTHPQFEESYLETLHRLHGTKRVRANQVYQE